MKDTVSKLLLQNSEGVFETLEMNKEGRRRRRRRYYFQTMTAELWVGAWIPRNEEEEEEEEEGMEHGQKQNLFAERLGLLKKSSGEHDGLPTQTWR